MPHLGHNPHQAQKQPFTAAHMFNAVNNTL